MNVYLVIVVGSLVGAALLNALTDALNLRALRPELPSEFSSFSDPETYRRSQEYTRAKTGIGLLASMTGTLLVLVFLLSGGFNLLDRTLTSFIDGPVLTGLAFFAVLFVLSDLSSLPFDLYAVFSIEQRFGFNTMTPGLFVRDKLKSYLLATAIGAPLLGAILWLFSRDPGQAWLLCWLVFMAFALVLQYIAPRYILPLFNRFTPLDEGELRERIERMAREQGFGISGIFVMDGSRRSTKSNAFFTGFGRTKRIALYDTLLERHDQEEILAILAHELGHARLGHIRTNLVLMTVKSAGAFWLLSLFVTHEPLFAALGMDRVSVHAGIVFFSLLLTPVSLVSGILLNMLSRRFERQADAFALNAVGSGAPLVRALKKLSVHNLSNLTPHPLHAFVHYSHPPVLQRVRALEGQAP
jgi:STE24 endopeptidase